MPGSDSEMQAQGGMAPAGDVAIAMNAQLVAIGGMAPSGSATLQAGTSMLTAPIFLKWGDNLGARAIDL